MKLERARELYSDYSEDALSPAMKLAFEQHLEADPAAREDYAQFATIFSALDSQADVTVEVPRDFRAKILELVETDIRRNARRSLWERAGDWLQGNGQPQRRGASGWIAGVAASLIALAIVQHNGATSRGYQGRIIPDIRSVAAAPAAMVSGVTVEPGADGTLDHVFHIRMPESISNATVNAYSITDMDQIIKPTVRAEKATLALKQPRAMQSNEELPIRLRPSEHAQILTLLVEWTPLDPTLSAGSQVIFAPLDASEAPSASSTVTGGNLNFFDALGAIAAQYHVTVIADAERFPTSPVAFSAANVDAPSALHAVTGKLGYEVRAINDHTFQVYAK